MDVTSHVPGSGDVTPVLRRAGRARRHWDGAELGSFRFRSFIEPWVDGIHPQSPARLWTRFTCFQIKSFALHFNPVVTLLHGKTRKLFLGAWFEIFKFNTETIQILTRQFGYLFPCFRLNRHFDNNSGTCFSTSLTAKFKNSNNEISGKIWKSPKSPNKKNNEKKNYQKSKEILTFDDHSVGIRWCTCCLIVLNCQSLTRHRVATSRWVLRRLAEEPHRHRLVQSLLVRPVNYCQVPQ